MPVETSSTDAEGVQPFQIDVLLAMEARAELVIWLPGALVDIGEFCEWLPEDLDRPICRQLPVLVRFAGGDQTPDAQDVAEALTLVGTTGFLVSAWRDAA